MDKIKALIFDCDGMILNTIPDYLNAMNYTLIHFGYNPINQDEIKSFLGYGTDHFLRSSLKVASYSNYDEIKKYYLDYYSKHFYEKTYPYEGINEFLIKAKNMGFKLAVCSNKPDFILKKLISSAFSEINFDYLSGQTDEYTKPNPIIMNRCLNSLKLKPNEVMYFGDTEVDYQFAKNSNILNCIIVTYGFRDKNYLKIQTNPVKFVENSKDLINLI